MTLAYLDPDGRGQADPHFVDPKKGNFNLKDESPPTRTISDTKFTIAPALTSRPSRNTTPTRRAVKPAKTAKRAVAPLDSSPSDAPPTSNEMADVTLIAVCRGLKNQPGEHAGVESGFRRKVGE